ncbi:MopE-related protein, partial [Thermodesulfobacteriota bacterium]
MNVKRSSGTTYLFFAVVMIAAAVGLSMSATAAVHTGVRVVDCIDNGSSLDCTEKTVYGVSVSAGKETVLEITPEFAPEPVHAKIAKSEPVYYYPLHHFHTVSYNPCEEVTPDNNTAAGVQSCIDSPTADDTTCDWTLDADNTTIDDSQGFCSNKDLELITDTTGLYRGEDLLGRASSAIDSFSTGHCVRMGELFYHGYEIGSPVLNYAISVALEQVSHTYDFVLSPTAPVFTSVQVPDDKPYPEELMSIKAELAGDIGFGPANPGLPELDNYILYVPAAPNTHPYVQEYQDNMLLVPREEVSKDGGGLDKVGVSFYTFRHLNGDIRFTRAGDGLHNQLYHKHSGDTLLLDKIPPAEADYLVHGKKDFIGSMDFESNMANVLMYKDTSISNSLINLVVDNASVKVTEAESTGIIIEAYVYPFTSLSKEGTLIATFQNWGEDKADYLVTVTECSMPILDAIPAKPSTLEPNAVKTLNFNIHTKFNLESTYSCTVGLKSPTGKLFDEVVVDFDTEKHTSQYSWELQKTNTCASATVDQDNDTFFQNDGDCDDNNNTVYSGAPELCDGLDNDCDTVVPDNETDADGDGRRICDGDCNDNNNAVYPGAPELCDGLDNDCDSVIPDNE